MSTNPYKAFVPFLITPSKPADDLSAYAVTEPSAGDWRRVGLCEPMKGEGFIVDLHGAGKMMAIQFNERILPGKVRDEHLATAVAKIERLEGRKVSKKEYAQLRQQVEFDLLPRAFIRRSVVPILFFKVYVGQQFMLVCTSSAKRADDCIEMLLAAFPESEIKPVGVNNAVDLRLLALAIDGSIFDEAAQKEAGFYSHDSIALKGDDKKVIRIKDKLIADGDVQDLLKSGAYRVVEMGIVDCTEESEPLTFVVSEHLIFKRIALPSIKTTLLKEDLFAYTVICVQTYKRMLEGFIRAFGGLAGSQRDGDDDL